MANGDDLDYPHRVKMSEAVELPYYNELNVPSLFIELNELRERSGREEPEDSGQPDMSHSHYVWLEIARWVKFEETFNEVGKRFNEAHVSPMRYLDVKLLCEVAKNYLSVIATDSATLHHAMEIVVKLSEDQGASSSEQDDLMTILMSERYHPDIKGTTSDDMQNLCQASTSSRGVNPAFVEDMNDRSGSVRTATGARASIVSTAFRRATGSVSHALRRHHTHRHQRFNQHLTDCLDEGSEACAVISGTVGFLSRPVMVLLRLVRGIRNSCVSEVDVPVRFIFVFIGPPNAEHYYADLARCFAVMMTNRVFRASMYEVRTVTGFIQAADLFLHDALVMPISRYAHPEALAGMVRQIEVYKREMEQMEQIREIVEENDSQVSLPRENQIIRRRNISIPANIVAFQDDGHPEHYFMEPKPEAEEPSIQEQCMRDFCPPFIELIRSVKPWLQRMPSDYKDAFTKDNVGIVFASIMFVYFVNLSPAITFGALLRTQVHPSYTMTLTILATGVYLVLFGLLSGQPLAIIGVSAPTFIVESSIVSVSVTSQTDLKQLRFWVAIYAAICGVFLIGINTSALANHIRRSVEEVYNSFIGFFFLLKALFTMFKLIPGPTSNILTDLNARVTFTQKMAVAGATLFLAFIMLQFCLLLAQIKRGTYFRRIIRKMLGAFSVPLGMILIAVMERIFFREFNLPKVDIPPSNQVNVTQWVNPPDYSRLLDYSGASAGSVHGIGFAIGLTLAVIIFTEVSLNGITALKNKAVKPGSLVFDLILMMVLFPIISGCIGWPFVSGTTVRTLSNLVALVKMDHKPPPGMPQKIAGTVEQRVSILIVGTIVALSIFLGSILAFIPLAALYGMFLYMGVMGLRDLQFIQRVFSLMKQRKHWEDWECVRGLPSRHILVFALFQGFAIAILVMLNIIAEFTAAGYAGIIFPIVLLIYALLREFAMPKSKWLNRHLHQLDPKYKIKPAPLIQPRPSMKSLNSQTKASIVSLSQHKVPPLTPDIRVSQQFAPATFAFGDDTAGFRGRHDGIVRETWAT